MTQQRHFFGLNESIRFGMQHLKNIASKQVSSPEQVEVSLEAFANDLEKDLIKTKRSPLALLMGILLKGDRYMSIDPEYKTEEETLLAQQMEAKIKRETKMSELKEKAKKSSFILWEDGLSAEKKQALLESLDIYLLEKLDERGKLAHLKTYYEETIWPKEYEEMRS